MLKNFFKKKQEVKFNYAHQSAEVFNQVASDYNLMNDIMSLFNHRLWRKYAIEALQPQLADKSFLDLGGGMGQMTAMIINYLSKNFCIKDFDLASFMVSDVNKNMLALGKNFLEKNINYDFLSAKVSFVQEDATNLLYNKDFDYIIMAFALRNTPNPAQVLANIFKALKPGGKFLLLEFSLSNYKPLGCKFFLQGLYGLYAPFIPFIGYFAANNYGAYKYFINSINKFYSTQQLLTVLSELGFNLQQQDDFFPGLCKMYILNKNI